MPESLEINTGNKLLDSRLLIGWGRISLALVIPVLGAFYALTIGPIKSSIEALDARISSLEKVNAEFASHFAVVDNTMIAGKAAREKWQTDAGETLRDIKAEQVEQGKQTAAHTALLQQLQNQLQIQFEKFAK